MIRPISSFIPDADDLLALEVEELAGVLLAHLNSYDGEESHPNWDQGVFRRDNFFTTPYGGSREYGDKQGKVTMALMEAAAWLESVGFLTRALDPMRFFISRRGKRMVSREDFEAYRKASLLPKYHLHPLIAAKVYPAFLRGEYDTAIFQAFREVEIAVRSAGEFPADLVGVNLMRAAFKPANNNNSAGPLTDTLLPGAEQDGMMALFAGAIALYKNPQSHRTVPVEAGDSAEVIGFASQLLRIVDRLKPRNAGESTA